MTNVHILRVDLRVFFKYAMFLISGFVVFLSTRKKLDGTAKEVETRVTKTTDKQHLWGPAKESKSAACHRVAQSVCPVPDRNVWLGIGWVQPTCLLSHSSDINKIMNKVHKSEGVKDVFEKIFLCKA